MERTIDFRQYLYYIMIGIISFVTLTFLPMFGSSVGIQFYIPDSAAGWGIYIVSKLIVSVLNVMIYFSFMQQAKLNIKEESHYKEALEILHKYKEKKYTPRSPKKWNAIQYGWKGTSIFLGSIASSVALTNAFLTYDYIALITYGLVIILGLIFGVMQMKKAEAYWTGEFYDYALEVEKERKEEDARLQGDNL